MMKIKALAAIALTSVATIGAGVGVASTVGGTEVLAGNETNNLVLTWKKGQTEIVSPGGWKIGVESDDNYVKLTGSFQSIAEITVDFTAASGKTAQIEDLYKKSYDPNSFIHVNTRPLTNKIVFEKGWEPSSINIWDANVSSIQFTYNCVENGKSIEFDKGAYLVGNESFTAHAGNKYQWEAFGAKKLETNPNKPSEIYAELDLKTDDEFRFKSENGYFDYAYKDNLDTSSFLDKVGDNYKAKKDGRYGFYVENGKIWISYTAA